MLGVFDQVEQASAAVSAIIARGLVPAAVEMIDNLTIQALSRTRSTAATRATRRPRCSSSWTASQEGMEAQAERIVAACREAGAREVRTAPRRGGAPAPLEGPEVRLRRLRPGLPRLQVMDGVSAHAAAVVLCAARDVVADGLSSGNVFHAGDGNLHPNILYDPRKPGEEARVVAAGAEIMKLCADVGGSISGEHGIGLEKADFMPLIFLPPTWS